MLNYYRGCLTVFFLVLKLGGTSESESSCIMEHITEEENETVLLMLNGTEVKRNLVIFLLKFLLSFARILQYFTTTKNRDLSCGRLVVNLYAVLFPP